MKAFSLLLIFAAAFVVSGCHPAYVERRRTVYVDRPGYYYRRPAPVVVVHRPYYPPRHVTKIVYYNDHHGRYYWRGGRRVYVRHY